MNDKLVLRIPKEMRDELEIICESAGSTMSVVVREALKRLIAAHKFDALRKNLIPMAEKAGIYSEEQVLKFRS